MHPVRAVLAALMVASMVAAACGTEAVGVDACRRIEQARCRRAPTCPDLAVSNVEACNAFARDRCLHGLAVAEPPVARLDPCVKAIEETTSCAVVATPELDPACSFLASDLGDGGPESAAAAGDASDGSASLSDASAASAASDSGPAADAGDSAPSTDVGNGAPGLEASAPSADGSDGSANNNDGAADGPADGPLAEAAPSDGSDR